MHTKNFDIIHFRLESLYAYYLIVYQGELLHLKSSQRHREVMIQ